MLQSLSGLTMWQLWLECCDLYIPETTLHFLISFSWIVSLPSGAMQYQTGSSFETVSLGLCQRQSISGFSFDKQSSKHFTGHSYFQAFRTYSHHRTSRKEIRQHGDFYPAHQLSGRHIFSFENQPRRQTMTLYVRVSIPGSFVPRKQCQTSIL